MGGDMDGAATAALKASASFLGLSSLAISIVNRILRMNHRMLPTILVTTCKSTHETYNLGHSVYPIDSYLGYPVLQLHK